MHESNVAHRSVPPALFHRLAHNLSRDLSHYNIMFDESGKMYPKGFHPASQNMELDFSQVARPRRRRSTNGLKYIFIDFGISSQFGSLEKRELVKGCMAQDPTIPELSDDVPYDPFAVDVYTLGNLYKVELLGVCLRLFLPVLRD